MVRDADIVPPFILDDSRPPLPKDYVKQLNELIAAGRRSDAVELFMTKAILIPAEMRNYDPMPIDDGSIQPPSWADMEKLAHTLAHDGAVMVDTLSGKPLPAKKWASAISPTLVINGEQSPEFMHDGLSPPAQTDPRGRPDITYEAKQ